MGRQLQDYAAAMKDGVDIKKCVGGYDFQWVFTLKTDLQWRGKSIPVGSRADAHVRV